MRHHIGLSFGIILVATMACVKDAKQAPPRVAEPTDQCYRSLHSVLLGQPTPRGQQGAGPGWIRLSGAAHGDSGQADLVDSDGKRLPGRWNRATRSSLRVVAFDDFLRVELALSVTGGGVAGEGNARSDATIEPDASGLGIPLRRQWPVAGVLVSCDSFPAVTAQ